MDYEKFMDVVVGLVGPAVEYLQSLSWLGSSTHFVKVPQLVRIADIISLHVRCDARLLKFVETIVIVLCNGYLQNVKF